MGGGQAARALSCAGRPFSRKGPSGRGPKALTGCEVIKRPWPPPWGFFSLALLDQMLWEKSVSETEASFLSLGY